MFMCVLSATVSCGRHYKFATSGCRHQNLLHTWIHVHLLYIDWSDHHVFRPFLHTCIGCITACRMAGSCGCIGLSPIQYKHMPVLCDRGRCVLLCDLRFSLPTSSYCHCCLYCLGLKSAIICLHDRHLELLRTFYWSSLQAQSREVLCSGTFHFPGVNSLLHWP